MKRKILTIVILIAFCACGFIIYAQQKKIRQWQNTANRYNNQVIQLKKELEAMSDKKEKNQTPVYVNLPDLSIGDEYEKDKLNYEKSQLEYEKTQLELEKGQLEYEKRRTDLENSQLKDRLQSYGDYTLGY